MDGEWNY